MGQDVNYSDVSEKCGKMMEIAGNIKNTSNILRYNYPDNKNAGEFSTQFNRTTDSMEETIGYISSFISKYAELLLKVSSCYAGLDTQLSEMTVSED